MQEFRTEVGYIPEGHSEPETREFTYAAYGVPGPEDAGYAETFRSEAEYALEDALDTVWSTLGEPLYAQSVEQPDVRWDNNRY